jgi:hypothetical protein
MSQPLCYFHNWVRKIFENRFFRGSWCSGVVEQESFGGTAVRNSNGDLRHVPRFNSSKRCRNLRKRRWARTLWSELWISVWIVHRCVPKDSCSTMPLNQLHPKNQFFLKCALDEHEHVSLLTSGLYSSYYKAALLGQLCYGKAAKRLHTIARLICTLRSDLKGTL